MPTSPRRLSDADAIFLPMGEAVGGAMAPVAISVFDRAPDPADAAHQRELLARLMPAMRRRIVRDRFSPALPRWVDVDGANPDDNFLLLPAPGDATLRAVLDWAQTWAKLPFPDHRPPWRSVQFDDVLVDGERRTVQVNQIHHALIDAGGARRMTEHYIRFDPDAPLAPLPPLPEPEHITAWERWKEGWADEGRTATAVGRATARRLRFAAREPRAAAARGRELIQAARRLTSTVGPEPLSPLLRRTSDRMRFDEMVIDFPALRAGAKAAGGSVNDGFMTAVSLGLRQWHLDHGVQLPELRTAMAVNRRKPEDTGWSGNEVLAVVVMMPVDEPDAVQLLKRCREVSLAHREDEDALWLMDRARAAGNRLPFPLAVVAARQSLVGLDVSLSNVAGLPQRTWNAHREQLRSIPFVVGTLSGLGMIMTSRGGRCDLGLTTCPEAVADPEHFLRRLQEGFEAVYRLAAPT